MTQIYTVGSLGTTFASGKTLLSVFNGTGSGRIVRIYRIWLGNSQTTAVTGVLTTLSIVRVSAASGGSSLTIIKHDTANEDLPASLTCVTNATIVISSTLRTLAWSNDEAIVATATADEWTCLPVIATIWDLGYQDTTLQPITLREGEGIAVKHTGTSAVGNVDVFIEFTLATT